VNGSVKKVAVVGRDAAVWIAAASLNRALGRAGVDIHVIELPSLLQAPDTFAAVPSIRGLHRLLGLEESIVVQACDAVPMVGQRFSNWSQAAAPFIHAFENEPPPGGDLPFTQYWLKGRLEGLKVDLSHFGVGTAAALQGRVPVNADDPALAAGFGYHLDALAYTHLLKRFALHNGVRSIAARAVQIEAEADRITAVTSDDGTRVEAQLYVDATGADGLLIRKVAGAEFDSWRKWFRADRMLAATAPPLSSLPAFSQISAFRAGWVGLFPLKGRTGVTAVYSSAEISDQELADSLPVVARMPICGDAVVSPLEPGMQKRPWIGNCVAVGDAAVAAEPLDGVHIHLAHALVSHLVNLFPADPESMPEADSFNRTVRRVAENVRDFQFAHYKLNRRYDDPFWDAARDATAPDTLERKMRLFELRGLHPLYDDESFSEWSWAQMFFGHGITPQDYDPRVDVVADEEHVLRVQGRMRDVADRVREMPTVNAFLAQAQSSRTGFADA
jgi:tryptophan halogenase